MKRIIRILALSLLILSLFGETGFLKTKSYQIGPGTYYSEYTHPEPWVLYVVEMDLTNPYITLESVKANDRLYAFEGPSSMSARKNTTGHYVVSAINGDFYDTGNGAPISTHIVNGEFVKKTSNSRSAFSYTEDKKLHIGSVLYSGNIYAKDTTDQWSNYPIASTNTTRGENMIITYNHFYGSTTQTNAYGYECLAVPIDPWQVNDTVRCVIEACESYVGNMAIPEGKVVISGHGTAVPYLSTNCQPGDTVMIVQNVANHLPSLTMLVGGGPRMLSNGADVVAASYPSEGIGSAFCSDRHPRTAIGFNQDSTKVYFVVVDGRQQGFSVGMNLYEMADFMKNIGIAHAVNLDGGGSSGMTVRNSIMNSPSDGSERRVANGIICVSSAPVGSLEHVQFIQDSLAVFKNGTINTNLTGWDGNYNPVGLASWDQINVNYDASLGTFSNNTFTADINDGNTYLSANYLGDIDSVLIHVIELTDLGIYPETVTIDSVNGVEFQITATNEANATKGYDNGIFEFSVLDPTIAMVDNDGFVIGKRTGETKVIVHYGDETDTATVKVEIGEGEVVVDELESINGWNISGDSFIEMNATSLSLTDRTAGTGSKAIKVDYSHTGNEDGMITLACDPVNIYGVPSYILVDVLSDSNKNWIYVDLEDARGVAYSVKCSASLRYNDDYRTQYLNMGNLLPSDGEQLYPLKVTGVRLRIDDLATTGTMYVDRIRLIYPGWTDVADEELLIPTSHKLYQNYPNPFNPVTRISFEMASAGNVSLDVFDINGSRIANLVKGYRSAGSYEVEFQADKLATGVYLYRLQVGNWVDTKKMLIIK